jgi:cytochrome c biogenesis protein CcmG, thiol:disulfide interchange protein DsbE
VPVETTERRGSTAVWVVIVAGIAIMVLGLVFAGRFGSDPSLTKSPLIGTPAPEVEIAGYDGGASIRLDDLLGDIVVVNFWASWCTGCRQEHEGLLLGASAYEDLGTTFVAVNYQDIPAAAEDFLEELGRSAVTLYGVDEGSRVAFEFGVLGLPETFFIDREGTVVAKVSGPISFELLAGTIEAIALGEAVDPEVTTGEVENR